MKILTQLGVVFGLFWLAEGVEAVLPFPFPASVISLLLLLVLLLTRALKLSAVRDAADFILGNLGFFFVPVSVSIMNYFDIVLENAAAFFTICVASTVLTYGATVTAVRLTRRLMEKRGGTAQ